jgi:hypothetical protein
MYLGWRVSGSGCILGMYCVGSICLQGVCGQARARKATRRATVVPSCLRCLGLILLLGAALLRPACIFYSHVPTASDASNAALHAFSCTVLKRYSFIFSFPFPFMKKILEEGVCRVLVFKAAGSNCRTASIRRHGPVEAKNETAKFSVLLGVVPGARGSERSPAALALPCDICTHQRARIHRSQITPLITPKCLSRHFRSIQPLT